VIVRHQNLTHFAPVMKHLIPTIVHFWARDELSRFIFMQLQRRNHPGVNLVPPLNMLNTQMGAPIFTLRINAYSMAVSSLCCQNAHRNRPLFHSQKLFSRSKILTLNTNYLCFVSIMPFKIIIFEEKT